jgi:hypothetical protein
MLRVCATATRVAKPKYVVERSEVSIRLGGLPLLVCGLVLTSEQLDNRTTEV